jgi:hypothetical protein
MGAAPWQDLQLWDQARKDAVTDQTGQAFLRIQRLAHSRHVTSAVFDAN